MISSLKLNQSSQDHRADDNDEDEFSYLPVNTAQELHQLNEHLKDASFKKRFVSIIFLITTTPYTILKFKSFVLGGTHWIIRYQQGNIIPKSPYLGSH